ncbi:MAG: 50S ribosomal protein L15 [Nitrospirota bacterium]
MPLSELRSRSNKTKKKVGRGNGSGSGTYSGRGMKGQSARTGGRRRPGFEGGQTPYLRKMPKLKGFKNPNYVEYQVINVFDLNIFDSGATVKKEDLLAKNLISKKTKPVKLLGGKGELEKALTIEVDKASASAIKAVESKKGKVVLPKAEKKAEPKKAESKAEKAEK